MVPRGLKQKVQSASSSEKQACPVVYHHWRGKEGPLGVLELPGTLDSSSSGSDTGERDFHRESTSTGEKVCAADLLCSEQLIPFNWEKLNCQSKTAPTTASDSEDEDEIMIYNHHPQQWQDELVLFNSYHHHKQPAAATEEEDLGTREKLDEYNNQQEQKTLLPLDSTKEEEVSGSKFCLDNLSDIDITANSFSFWPDEAIFYSRPSSPSFFPGSPSERYPRQSHDSVYSQRMNIQPPSNGNENLNSTLPTAKLEYTTLPASAGFDGEKHRTAGVKWFDYEWSLGNWTLGDDAAVIPMALQHDGVSLTGDAHPGGKVQDKSWMDLHRVPASTHQEWKGPKSLNQTYIASSSRDQSHEEQQLLNQFGDPTQSLQESEGDLLLFPNTKRDRTNSIEMLSKPTSALRKKKQKDGEIPEGRLRGTSICMDLDLQYGLATLHHLLKDFHEHAAIKLADDVSEQPRPDAADLLDSELEALSIEENLAPEIRRAVVAALKHGDGSQPQGSAVDWELVEQILNLKMYLVSLLEESRAQEQLILSQLKDTISRYSFLFPASVERTLLQRWSQRKCFKDLENTVCQSFRESELFSSWSSSSSASSSSSGRAGAGSSSRASSSSSALPLVPFSHEQASARAAAESEGGGGDSVSPADVAETSERLRITSRRELSGARGNLPRVAAEFMRSWLFDNFDNP
ncbi:hypothetical protein R1sor_002768 [Riccia sorocarpa]|uniref:Uncharacterized protein n=1 Tax=Riccia sorocarpa TaxID=122646 RepID=A0ABD3H3W6_9MARC